MNPQQKRQPRTLKTLNDRTLGHSLTQRWLSKPKNAPPDQMLVWWNPASFEQYTTMHKPSQGQRPHPSTITMQMTTHRL